MNDPGIAHELAARPIEPGIVGDRNDGHAEFAIDMRDAVFVMRRRTRRRTCAFRIDHQLPASGNSFARTPDRHFHGRRTFAAIDRHHFHFLNVPAEQRNPGQFPLEDIDRIGDVRQEGIGVPEGLVLRRTDVRTVRNILQPIDVDVCADDHLLQPQVRFRPVFRNAPRLLARAQEIIGREDDHPDDQIQVEECVEGE